MKRTIIMVLLVVGFISTKNTFANEYNELKAPPAPAPAGCAVDVAGLCAQSGASCKTYDGKAGSCNLSIVGCRCVANQLLLDWIDQEDKEKAIWKMEQYYKN